MTVELSILGPIGAARGDVALDVGGPKQQALLAFLLVHTGGWVDAHLCLEAVWDDQPPDGAVRSLRTYISNLRRLLGPEVEIETVAGGYRLVLEDAHLDAGQFEAMVASARAIADPRRRFARLSEALGLWGDRPLAGLTNRLWASIEADRFDEMRARVVADRFEAALESGLHHDLLPEFEAAAADRPLDERLATLAMLALYRSGRQADALRAGEAIRRRLADQLGVEPTPDLITLERRILNHDPVLRWNRAKTNLPHAASSFVGRTSELAELAGVVTSVRLVTLLGPGGAGKTRLAVELGHRLTDRFADGVWVCDLAPAPRPEAVDDLVGAALGVQPRTGMDRLEAVAEFLVPKKALVIMDNCEHVARRAAVAVARLVGACPGLTVVATSRVPLHVEGERSWGVDPLAVPEEDHLPGDLDEALEYPSIRLLVDRASNRFRPADSQAGDLARLARRLDGLPLALELAASRLATMTLEEVLGDIDGLDRFESSTVDGDVRHRTLQRTVAWSHDLLPEASRAGLARLGVFSGTFGAFDASAVSGTSLEDTGRLLRTLVDSSLVVADTSGDRTRFRLLETIRAFALDRLSSAEVDTLRSRHASHYAGLVTDEAVRLNGPEEPVAVNTIADAFSDIRAAAVWALDQAETDVVTALAGSIADFSYWRGAYETATWATEAVELPDADAHPDWPALCGSAARGMWLLGRFTDAKRYARAGDRPTIATPVARSGHPHDVAADVDLYEGRTEAALDHYRSALEDASVRGDLLRVSWTQYYLAVVSAVAGLGDDAVAYATECRRTVDDLANPTAVAYATYAQALAVKRHQPARAEALFNESARIARGVSNDWFEGIATMESASITAFTAEPAEAVAIFGPVVDHWDRAGDRTQLRLTWRYLLRALARAGLDEEAAVLIGALEDGHGPARGVGLVRPPGGAVKGVRARLSEDAYTKALVRGGAMSHAELVEHARQVIRSA